MDVDGMDMDDEYAREHNIAYCSECGTTHADPGSCIDWQLVKAERDAAWEERDLLRAESNTIHEKLHGVIAEYESRTDPPMDNDLAHCPVCGMEIDVDDYEPGSFVWLGDKLESS